MKTLDRLFFVCPCINKDEIEKYYQPLSEEGLLMMSLTIEKIEKPSDVQRLFAHVRTNLKGETYLEVDFIVPGDGPLVHTTLGISYRRFIIQRGYMMSEDDEEAFVKLCSEADISIDEAEFVKLQSEIDELWPDIPIRAYGADEAGKYFMRVYFSTHFCGAKEILYKAGLDRIAERLDRIEDYNIIGGSPEELFCMPIRLLRILDQPGFTDRILKRHSRVRCMRIYYRYNSYFSAESGSIAEAEPGAEPGDGPLVTEIEPGDRPLVTPATRVTDNLPNIYQWRYLEKYGLEYRPDLDDPEERPTLLENETDDSLLVKRLMIHSLFDVAIFHELKECRNEVVFDSYIRFVEFRERWREFFYTKKVPPVKEIQAVMLRLEPLEKYLKNMDYWDRLLADNNHRYDYEDEWFKVVTPVTVLEFFHEANAQSNCLMTYLERVARGETNVVFVRQKNAVAKSYITVEIRDGIIVNARARFNKIPDEMGRDFIKRMALHFGLDYSPGIWNDDEAEFEADEDYDE